MVLHKPWRLLFGFAIAAVALGSVPTVSASATAKQPSVHPAAYVPLLNSPAVAARNAGKSVSPADLLINMDYNGGPVMPCFGAPAFYALSNGHHTLVAWSYDPAGNRSLPVHYGWTVDTTVPAGQPTP